MLTEQQRLAIEAATKVLQMAGITAWFEARIIKDSDKKLNGRRISSKRRTDLDRVLKVAESKRVGMLPDMRMELRMYATAASSRSVFMGKEQLPPGDALMVGTMDRVVKHVSDGGAYGGLVEGRANYSPAKNVERLRGEGVAEDDPVMEKAKKKGRVYSATFPPITGHTDVLVLPGTPPNLGAPLANMRTVAQHTCDAAGPMRQREPGGPFHTTCSLCGEINAATP